MCRRKTAESVPFVRKKDPVKASKKTIMKTQNPIQKRLLWGVVLVAAGSLVALALFVAFTSTKSRPGAEQNGNLSTPLRQANIARVPPFTLTERSGKEIALADLRGLVWIADFIWTRCPDACPLMSGVMARLQSEFAGEPEFRLVSISVDPQYDTPAVLTRYAARYGADLDRWLFLTGDKETVYRLVRDGFKLAVRDPDDPQAFRSLEPLPGTSAVQPVLAILRWLADLEVAWAHVGRDHRQQPVIHSDRFVLVDGTGWIQGYYNGTEPQALEQLIQDTRKLVRMGHTQKQ